MGNYQPLFTVSVDHLYFSTGVWRALDFVPNPGTSKVIRGAEVLFRPTINGIGVFYDEDKSRALRLYAEEADGALNFSFKVYSKDRTFANYTSPSFHKENAILCFDNRGHDGDTEARKIKLSKDDFVSDKDFEEIDALIAGGILCASDRPMPPDFVVNVVVDCGTDGTLAARNYGIRFNARQSFWKYHLLGNMNRDNLFIVDLDNRVEFEFCGEIMLPGNRTSKVFMSKELMPVQEKSSYRFQLKEQGIGAGKVLIKRLPVASETRLSMAVINGKSEIILESFINF